MHTPETREKFIERRAQGWPLARLVTELGVARSTLIEWSRQHRFEIQNRRAVELEALAERLLGTRQSRTSALSARLALVEAELKKRDLAQVSTARLLLLSAALQRELRQELGEFRCATPIKDIPADEYVEEIQEWSL